MSFFILFGVDWTLGIYRLMFSLVWGKSSAIVLLNMASILFSPFFPFVRLQLAVCESFRCGPCVSYDLIWILLSYFFSSCTSDWILFIELSSNSLTPSSTVFRLLLTILWILIFWYGFWFSCFQNAHLMLFHRFQFGELLQFFSFSLSKFFYLISLIIWLVY